jgi:hypothetical protein
MAGRWGGCWAVLLAVWWAEKRAVWMATLTVESWVEKKAVRSVALKEMKMVGC